MARTKPKRRRRQDASTRVDGGAVNPLAPAARERIHRSALDILGNIGLAEAPYVVVDLVSARGGHRASGGRLRFPCDPVEEAIATLPGSLVLCGRHPVHDLELAGTRVLAGAGGRSRHRLHASLNPRRPSRCGAPFRWSRPHSLLQPATDCTERDGPAWDRQKDAGRLDNPGHRTYIGASRRGAVAQSGERRVRNAKVRSSNPLSSTRSLVISSVPPMLLSGRLQADDAGMS